MDKYKYLSHDKLELSSIVAFDDFVTTELIKIRKPTISDSVLLVLSDKVCYKLETGDKFVIFSQKIDGLPDIGKYIVASDKDDYSFIAKTSIPEDAKFVSQIYGVTSDGNYKVIVLNN